MADRKITDLTALAAGSQATGDLVTVVDVSEAAAADKNKKMTMENLFKGIPGNVGVGVSSPAAKLEVQGAATSSAIAAHIKAGDGGSTVGLIVDGDSESGDVLLKARSNSSASPSDSDTKFIIQGDGSIGIGTASLSTTGFNRVLRIKSSTSAAGIFAEAPDTSSWLGLYGGTGTGDSAALLYPDTGSFRIGSTSAVGTTGFSEKLRIDSSGRVGIGESSPDRLLHLKAASNTAYSGGSDTADYNFLKIENTTDDKSAGIFFQIGGNGEAAITAIEASDGATDIAFQSRGGGVRSEKMRLDSSGRLLVGTTAEGAVDADNLTIADSGNCGLTIRSGSNNGGSIYFSDATSGDAEFDGFIAYNQPNQFMQFGTAQAERLRIQSAGGISFNGDTAAANALDDYEEGDFTPSWGAGLTSPSYATQSGKYTKIGRTVYFTLQLSTNGGTANSSALRIDGFPFNAIGTSATGGAFVNYFAGWGIDTPFFYKNQNDKTMNVYAQSNGAVLAGNAGSGIANVNLYLMGFYFT